LNLASRSVRMEVFARRPAALAPHLRARLPAGVSGLAAP
jgi:hypothetical protein